ncbi:hypothetical protein [Desulfospira joergensenii]|uniref:hypothetical protein n=1 Tax=Desulfospira joergensenii TaxID=53329 RepID=UPI0003B2F259|nr:hypothetical protein [Desulfospira joergensenii]
MNDKIKDIWYYVIVQNPETPRSEILGYTDEKTKAVFIPAFKSKEIAQQCFMAMPKDVIKEKYEAQAIIAEDLITHARKTGHEVLLLDDRGKVLEKIV